MLLTIVAGARPNFMKIAPIIRAINNAKTAGKSIDFRLVHTGQHYDKSMSGSFFEQLNIPEPHANLNCGGGTHAEQPLESPLVCGAYTKQGAFAGGVRVHGAFD